MHFLQESAKICAKIECIKEVSELLQTDMKILSFPVVSLSWLCTGKPFQHTQFKALKSIPGK